MRNGLLGAFLALGACAPLTPTPQQDPPASEWPGDATVDVGECEGSPYRSAGGTGDTGELAFDPALWAEVSSDRRLVVHLDDMSANCCPSPSATFSLLGDRISLVFDSAAGTTSGCDCVCVFDFVATSEPLDAGDYQLEPSYDGADWPAVAVTVP